MTIHRTAAIVAAFFLTCASTPATAASPLAPPAPAAPVGAQDAEAAGAIMTDWLARIAAWGQGYERVLESRSQTLLWLIDLTEELTAKIEAGETRNLRALTTQRAAEARARLAADITAYQALPTTMPPLDPRIPVPAAQRNTLQSMAQMPDRVGSMLISTGQSSETYLQHYEAAASGSQRDLIRLGAALMDMSASQMEAENAMLQGNVGNPATPMHHFSLASIETNKAMMAWLQNRRRIAFEEPNDPVASAAVIRGHAAGVTLAADGMDGATARLESLLRSEPAAADTTFGQLMSRLFVDFRASTLIERDIAAVLVALADAVETGDKAAQDALMERFTPLIDQRIQHDTGRRQLMAQMGS